MCDEYLSERAVGEVYASHLRRVGGKICCLTTNSVNTYLRSRLDFVSRTTVANERRLILTLWRWAYETGSTELAPRGVMSIATRTRPVQAWTIANLQKTVKASIQKKGVTLRNGADLGRFLECWIRLGYETGARWGDLWKMHRQDFHGSMIRFCANKTGSHIHRVLSDECIAAVDRMLDDSPDGTVLGWVAQKRHAMKLMKEHLRGCGLDGTSKWLRRSGATHVEQQQPGQAKVFLGHRTAGLAERNYIDWAQLGGNGISVPRLGGGG